MFYDDDLTKIIDQYATPAAREVDANGEFPQASINALQSVDLLGITVSEEFGGGGLGHVHRRDPGEDPETRPPGAPAWLGLGVTVGGKQDYLGDGELADVPGAAPGCPRPRRDRRTRARAQGGHVAGGVPVPHGVEPLASSWSWVKKTASLTSRVRARPSSPLSASPAFPSRSRARRCRRSQRTACPAAATAAAR